MTHTTKNTAYTLTRTELNTKAAKYHYQVIDQDGKIITDRKSNREYVACTIDGSLFFGRLDLIGKGEHGRALKIHAAKGTTPCPIAYLVTNQEAPAPVPTTEAPAAPVNNRRELMLQTADIETPEQLAAWTERVQQALADGHITAADVEWLNYVANQYLPATEPNTNPPAHTPGPWSVEKFALTNFLLVKNINHGAICEIPADSKKIPEHQANANLIAAAPDLLKALQYILEKATGAWMTKAERLEQIAGISSKAIAKAKG